MSLSDEQIHDCFQQSSRDKATERRLIARAIEAEVRKDDEALIRQMLDALTAPVEGDELHALHMESIVAARARLEKAP